MSFPPYQPTLNGKFLGEGEDYPCYELLEPFHQAQEGVIYPESKIFPDYHFLEEEIPNPKIKQFTEECLDYKALSLLFDQERV